MSVSPELIFAPRPEAPTRRLEERDGLALQLPFLTIAESMGNHDSKIVDAGSVD
jgi:hypothetical protein